MSTDEVIAVEKSLRGDERRQLCGILLFSRDFTAEGEVELSGAMKSILTLGGTMNAFPSLHAAYLVLLARLTWRMFRRTWWRWTATAA